MLTSSSSSNQYLRPDYLSPLPATLDAKNSPLALLAQTCSAIGTDAPNPKLLAHIEKSTKSHKNESRDKASPVSSQSSSLSTGSADHKSSFKPYESNNNSSNNNNNNNINNNLNNSNNLRERLNLTPEDRSLSTNLGNNNNSIRIKTPKNSASYSATGINGQRCDSNQSATSQRDSPGNGGAGSGSGCAVNMNNNGNGIGGLGGGVSANVNGIRKTPSTPHQLSNQDQNPSPHRASSKESGNVSIPHESPLSSRLSDIPKESNSMKSLHTSSVMTPTTMSGGTSYYPGYPPGFPYPMDIMTASAMMSPHHPMFKAATLNPYLNYARLKGSDPTTAAMMQSVCRDPYCTGCPSSPHFLNKAAGQPCPAGCAQCESPASKSYQSHGAAAAYAHAQLAALAAASQMPYVCSWIAGDSAYCGKRFSTSDELFQHLRTHTASMPESMLSAAAAGLPPTHPLFQRTYPTPPLSPLSTARYHPYSKPSMLPPPPSLAGLPMPPHPSLAQYFSPYSLYGPRLGSSHP